MKVLFAVSFALAIVVPFYSFAVPKLVSAILDNHSIEKSWVPAVMTIGQLSEFPILLLLPFLLKKFGMKATFLLGMGAWFLRYLLFAVTDLTGMVLAGIALNGICHVCLIIVIQLHVDSQCRKDLRASAQNLIAFMTLGIAMPLGFLLAGQLGTLCKLGDPAESNYKLFFAFPAFVVLALMALFGRYYRVAETESNAIEPSVVAQEK